MGKYDFGNKLYALRTEKNLTQKELAKILGISDKAVSKWETGEAMPRLKTLQAIAECFSVSYEDLLSKNSEESVSLPIEEKESAENPYEKFYNKRLKKSKRDIKISLVILSVILILSFCITLLGNFTATLYGMMMPSLSYNIVFNLLPLIITVVFCFFANKVIPEIDNIDIEIYRKRYLPTLLIPIFICSLLYTVKNLINENSVFSVVFACFALLILLSVIFILVKKDNCIESIHKITLASLYVPIISLIPSALFAGASFFDLLTIRTFLDLFVISYMLCLICEINKTLVLIQTLKKVETPSNPQKVKFKKIVTRAFVVLIVLLTIISIILTLFPGILIKYTLAKSWENPSITFFENYDVEFAEGEANTFRIGDITIDIPVNYTMEDKSFSDDERYWWFIEEDKMAMSLECFPLISLLHGEDSEMYTTSSALQEKEDTERFKKMLINTFGTYPRNEFQYKKLMYSLDADDINIFNYEQCITYTVLLASRDMYTMGNYYDITLYERGEFGAEIMKLKSTDKEMYSVSIYIEGDEREYHITFNGNHESVEVLYKMLNSIEVI